jgi:NAD(P)H-flavin reductase
MHRGDDVTNPYMPWEAEVVERIQETRTVVTLRLRLLDPQVRAAYHFEPGQFNMLYLFGGAEIPISIVSTPKDEEILDHTIRAVGRITRAMVQLQAGDRVGVRGPYGRGWPLREAEGKNLVLVTGGLGCAPMVSVINYVIERRDAYQHLTILQGVKHSADLIWRSQYDRWARLPQTQVLLAADVGGPQWPFSVGNVTVLLDQAEIYPDDSSVMMCGPERMMQAAANDLMQRGVPDDCIWLSMERNMQCGIRHCGHCQYGPRFVCSDGPVFNYTEVEEIFGRAGF